MNSVRKLGALPTAAPARPAAKPADRDRVGGSASERPSDRAIDRAIDRESNRASDSRGEIVPLRSGSASVPPPAPMPPSGRSVPEAQPYQALFGARPYVADGSDPQLLALVQAAIARSPELAAGPLGSHVRAGRVERADIQALQRFLARSGHSVGAPGADGKYGPLTHRALQAFLAQPVPSSAPLPPAPPPPASVPAGVSPAAPPPPAPSPEATSPPAPSPEPSPTLAPSLEPSSPVDAQPIPAQPIPAQPITAQPITAQPIPAQLTAAPGDTTAVFPPRLPDAPSGSEFVSRIRNLPIAQREDAIVQEVLRGNVPDFLRQMSSVRVSARGTDGQMHEAVVPVLPDYLAVGHDGDFVRVPLSPLAAQRLADGLGLGLPTRKLVNDVYHQAATKVPPRPMDPIGHKMMSVDYFDRHNRIIEGQLTAHNPGDLVAGHKKDVIVSNAVGQHPGKVIIYGWHQPNGKAIQPLSWIHENTYSDYSHGVRFVGTTILVDGQPRNLADVLADRELSGLVSDEGPIRSTRYPV